MANSGASPLMWGITVELPSLALDIAYHGGELAKWTRAVRELVKRAPADEPRVQIVDRNLPGDSDLAIIDRLVEQLDLM